jgi:phosphoglycolate phosphatase-like HAD superfamily hydrolase
VVKGGADLVAGSHVVDLIRSKRLLFWDFDGVIKDSVDVKTKAFEALFSPYGVEIVSRVREHHEANGGVSRFDKIPLYLQWAGASASDVLVKEFCSRFSELALQGVIDSPWVKGIPNYLQQNYEQQYFVLLTATPQDEIEHIIDGLDISHYFREVYGAPMSKTKAIADVLRRLKIERDQTLMIGDTETDMLATQDNGIPFLLRCTPLNPKLQTICNSPMFEDLTQ